MINKFSFSEALEYLKAGDKVSNEMLDGYYIVLTKGHFELKNDTEAIYLTRIREDLILSEDWFLYDEGSI